MMLSGAEAGTFDFHSSLDAVDMDDMKLKCEDEKTGYHMGMRDTAGKHQLSLLLRAFL